MKLTKTDIRRSTSKNPSFFLKLGMAKCQGLTFGKHQCSPFEWTAFRFWGFSTFGLLFFFRPGPTEELVSLGKL